jgi:hypothetical protein
MAALPGDAVAVLPAQMQLILDVVNRSKLRQESIEKKLEDAIKLSQGAWPVDGKLPAAGKRVQTVASLERRVGSLVRKIRSSQLKEHSDVRVDSSVGMCMCVLTLRLSVKPNCVLLV